MTVRELKKVLEGFSEEDLDKHVGYHFPDMCCSGFIIGFNSAPEDLYYDGMDDPSDLKTREELLEDYTEREIDGNFIIEIHQGDPIILL